MKKFICMVLMAALLAANVYGAENAEYENDAVIITYEQALEMALGEMMALHDIDIILRDLREPRQELRYLLTRMEDGRFRQEILNELSDQFGMLSMNLGQALQAQHVIGTQASQDMEAALIGIAANDMEAMLLLGNAVSGMAAAQGMASSIAMMEAQRAALIEAMADIQNDDNFDEIVRDTRRSLNDFDRQLEVLAMNQDQIRLSIDHALRGILIAYSELGMFIKALEAELALATQSVEQMVLLYGLGMVSSRALQSVEHGLTMGHMQLQELLRNQVTLHRSINELLGQPLLQNTVIELNMYPPELPEDFAQQAGELAATVHSVILLEMDLASARDARWVHTGHNRNITISASDRRRAFPETRPNTAPPQRTEQEERDLERLRNRINTQEAVERSETALAQALRSTEAAILRAYTEFTSLYAQLRGHMLDLALAYENLEIVRIHYSLGQATQMAVDEAYMAVFRVEQSIERVINQKWLLAFRLENPSLLA